MFWSESESYIHRSPSLCPNRDAAYRFIFTSWPFFAATYVVAYVMVIISTILAVWCRFNFGQGFAHFSEDLHCLFTDHSADLGKTMQFKLARCSRTWISHPSRIRKQRELKEE